MAEMGIKNKDMDTKLPRAVPVKNKQPAQKQMTAEQLLREAKHMQVGLRGGKATCLCPGGGMRALAPSARRGGPLPPPGGRVTEKRGDAGSRRAPLAIPRAHSPR